MKQNNLLDEKLYHDFFLEEETDVPFEAYGTWGSFGTFSGTVGGCASTFGTASSFG